MSEKQGSQKWDAEVDVIVVGFGAAGAAAALEAAQQGASVLVLDRFHGGGATAASGAIIYAGGGTPYQKAAGFEDTPDEMYKYLKQEVGDAISDETLRRFCQESPGMITWLEKAGVPFEASLCPFKTSYPTDKYYLYFSGNENHTSYKASAKPAPRGHRARGPGISGLTLFHALEKTVRKQGVQVKCQTQALQLVFGEDGKVIGVEARSVPGPFSHRIHGALSFINAKANTWMPPMGPVLNNINSMVMNVRGKRFRARARKGVILCAGGFMFNKEMVLKHNTNFRGTLPLGTFGDDGAGIRLGESAGGATARMDRMTAWRFYVPPEALMQGILLDKKGQRICSEDLYGAKQGDYVIGAGGKAFLIFDSKVYEEAVKHFGDQCAAFQKLTQIPSLRLFRKKGATLNELAVKIRLPADAVEKTISEYNALAREGKPDVMGKTQKRFVPIDTPPFYALDESIRGAAGIPTAAMTLGGLVVNEQTGEVKRKDGSSIEGLYAAGRNAIGLCSNGYFASGTSIADCIFAGRRAGGHAAGRQLK